MSKTIIITGASDGLGKALAQLCIKNKFGVINISRTPCTIKGVENISCDLSNEDDLLKTIEIIKTKYSDFSVLVNNAAIVGHSEINKLDFSKLEKTFKINTIAPLFLVSKLFDLIVKNQADIINVGTTHSQHAHPGMEGQLAYVSSKYGLRGGSYNIAKELKETKSRMIHVHLGGFQSKMHEKDYGNVMQDPQNWMTPSDIAEILLYLVGLPKQIEISEITINRKTRRMI
ncbi:MAG: SDR family oxidoreductase [Firmicutes bacterium]|nr:SDR family oxidoreductase [Bacillota bacterium]